MHSLVNPFISRPDFLLTSSVASVLSLRKSTFACNFIFYILSLEHVVFIPHFLGSFILLSWPESWKTMLSYLNMTYNLVCLNILISVIAFIN